MHCFLYHACSLMLVLHSLDYLFLCKC
uniref:Uncharacterized protein n=1 Tax=Arundo donax TaxID=35708 RepID=A0A0A9EEF3_ARUDO